MEMITTMAHYITISLFVALFIGGALGFAVTVTKVNQKIDAYIQHRSNKKYLKGALVVNRKEEQIKQAALLWGLDNNVSHLDHLDLLSQTEKIHYVLPQETINHIVEEAKRHGFEVVNSLRSLIRRRKHGLCRKLYMAFVSYISVSVRKYQNKTMGGNKDESHDNN